MNVTLNKVSDEVDTISKLEFFDLSKKLVGFGIVKSTAEGKVETIDLFDDTGSSLGSMKNLSSNIIEVELPKVFLQAFKVRVTTMNGLSIEKGIVDIPIVED